MLASCRHDVGRPGSGAFRCLLVGLALLAPAWAAAADIETRDFHITVDGKSGGDVHMTIHRQDDGTVSMQCDTDILLSYLGGLKKYVYTYRGKEVWKAGRLQRLDSTCNDDGKRYVVSAVPEGWNTMTSASAAGATHLLKSAPGISFRLGAVSMMLGSTQLTLIPLSRSSAAMLSVRRMTTLLEAE